MLVLRIRRSARTCLGHTVRLLLICVAIGVLGLALPPVAEGISISWEKIADTQTAAPSDPGGGNFVNWAESSFTPLGGAWSGNYGPFNQIWHNFTLPPDVLNP